MSRTTTLARVLFAVLSTVPMALAQDAAPTSEARDPTAAIERYKDYLQRKPFHDWAFDKLLEAVIARNQLRELVGEYEKQLATDPDNRSAKIVLARLYARTDRAADALAALDALADKDAPLFKLIGDLRLRQSDYAGAEAALDQAAKLTKDAKLLQDIHRLRGEAKLAAGNRAGAAEAFLAMGDLDPKSFNTRLEVASVLARHGLHEEAIKAFEQAESLAGEDAAKRCRVLSELGRLQEQRLAIKEALATYRQAIALMGRGNWLKKDLYQRILALERRGGNLDALVAASRADVEKSPQDIDAREFLAQVLAANGQGDAARDVLKAAVEAFPDDLKLSRALIDTLQERHDADAVIAEYQRVLLKHPEELELYIELGTVFAKEQRLEQAKLQWSRTLEKRLQDASLCARLAALYAFYSMHEQAIAMYEKAIQLEPQEIHRYAELVDFLAAQQKGDAIPPVLERARKAADGNASRLEEVSALWRAQKNLERAREAITAAVALQHDDPRLLAALADLQIEMGEEPQGAETLHRVINLATESQLRTASVDRLVRIFRKGNRLPALLAEEEKRVASQVADAAPYLVLSKLYAIEREPGKAIEALVKLCALHPEHEEARKQLARLYQEQGDYARALAQYDELIARAPQSRRVYLEDMARIHLARLDQEKALECLDQMVKSAPDNPAVFQDVAQWYRKLNMHDRATECLTQALRLKPDDGKTRIDLAELLLKGYEPERAKAELLLAMQTKDEDVRDDARKRFYALLGELGEVDDEMERLKKKVDENPYDVQSPLVLADLYTRELEYELALEMLDKLLTFQPREPKLLEQRARIYALMERHPDAIGDYETLLKLPDAERDRLALKVAEQAVEAGDVARAREVSAQVQDKLKVAQLFRKKRLLDEAIAILEDGVARAPNDPRMHARLADVYRDKGDRAAAIRCLERALAIQGDDWRTLNALGDLYHETGQKEEAIGCGKRLFTMVRMRNRKQEKDDDEARRRSYWDPWGDMYFQEGEDTQYSQSLSEIGSYFRVKGLNREYGEIASAEVLLQPTNVALFNQVTSHLTNQDKNGALAESVIRQVRSLCAEGNRFPPTYTAGSWAESLDLRLVGVYRGDAKVAERRAAELAPLVAAGSASERDFVELAQLHELARKDAEQKATFEQGLARFPDSPQLLAGLAKWLAGKKQFLDAVPLLEHLVAVLERLPDDGELEARRQLAFKQARQRLRQQLPISLQSRVTDQDLERVHRLTWTRSTGLAWTLGSRPTLDGARAELAGSLIKAGRRDDARPVLAALAPRDDDDLSPAFFLGDVYFANEFLDEAQAIYERLVERGRAWRSDPLLAHFEDWRWRFRQPSSNLARIYEKKGDFLRAFEVLRSAHDAGAAQLVLSTSKQFEPAVKHYEDELARAEAALAAAAARDDVEGREASGKARLAVYDAGVKLAELHQFQSQWDEALATYQRIAPLLPEEFEVPNVIAQLAERAEHIDDAVRVENEIIAAKRKLNRAMQRDDRPKPDKVQPTPPPRLVGGSEEWIWQNLSSSWRGGSAFQPRFDLRENYVFILRLYLDRRMISRAAEMMRTLARDDAASWGWISYELARLVSNYNLGADGLPILRLLYGQENEYNEEIGLQYAKCLVAANRLPEAEKVLSKVLNQPNLQDYYRRETEEELKNVEARLGVDQRQSLAELRSEVEKDPKNVKRRVKLARRLLDRDEVAAALEQALAAEALAPHQDEVIDLAVQCELASGRYQDAVATLSKQLESVKEDERRFEIAVRMAENLLADGKVGEIEKLVATIAARASQSYNEYSFAFWYLEKGLYAQAKALLESDLQRVGNSRYASSWYASLDTVRARLRQVDLLQGDPVAALDLAYKKLEESPTMGERASAFLTMASTLQLAVEPESYRERVLAAADRQGGVRGELYRAAYHLAVGAVPQAEEVIGRVLASGPETIYLYPLAIGLARARGDLKAALARMEELERINPGSAQQSIAAGPMTMSERDAFRAEKGGLLFDLGEKEAALQLWQEILDPTQPLSRRTLALVYDEHKLHDEAQAMFRQYLEVQGERSTADLEKLAEIERHRHDFEGQVAALERAVILASSDDNARQQLQDLLLQAYRDSGRLPDYLEKLAQRAAADPGNLDAWRALAAVATELGDDRRAIEALETIAKKPGFEKSVLHALVLTKRSAGDFEGAVQALERMSQSNTQEWDRRELHRQMADLYRRLGDLPRAVDALKRGSADPESVDLLEQVAGFSFDCAQFADAFATLQRVVEIDPKRSQHFAKMATCKRELGDPAGALDWLVKYLRSGRATLALEQHRGPVLALADAVHEDDRVRTALAEHPDDPELEFRSGLLAFFRGRLDASEAPLQRLLAARPDELAALDLLREIALARDDRKAAIARTEQLAQVLEQKTVLVPDLASLERVEDELAQFALREGDVERAVAAWRHERSRSRRPEVYRYSYGNAGSYWGGTPLSQRLLAHRQWDRALDELRLESIRGSQSWGDPPRVTCALVLARRGETERARAILWKAILDPTGGQVPAVSTRPYWDEEDQPNPHAAEIAALITVEREAGHLDELHDDVNERLAHRPDDPNLELLARQILLVEERREELLALLTRDLEKAPGRSELELAIGRLLLDLDRAQEAIPYLERVVRANRASAVGANEMRRVTRVSGAGGTTSSTIRFQWAGATQGSSSYSYYRSSGQRSDDLESRSLLAAAYAKVGRSDDAKRLETECLNLGSYRDRSVPRRLGAAYADRGLFLDSERWYEQAIADQAASAQHGDAIEDLKKITALWRKANDAPKHDRAVQRTLDAYAQKQLETPMDRSLYADRASFLLREHGELGQVERDAAKLAEIAPRDVEAVTLRAWIALRRGDAKVARELFDKADAELAMLGRESSRVIAGRGLALLALGEEAEARKQLRRARSFGDLDQDLLDEVKAALHG